MRLTITFTVLALCAHVPSANAGLHEESPCRFTQVTSRNGLSYNSVKCVMQDSRGYVWIGTYKGLNRYDGTRIKNYGRQDLGVKSDYINVLAEDSAGNVLIGTDNGIVIYDYRKDSFRQPLQAELLDDRIYSIHNDSKGISWIGSRAQGLFSYDPETDAVSKIDLKNPEGKLVRDIYRIVIDRNDKMHVAVYCDNLYRLTGDFTMERLATSGKAGYFEKDDIEGLVLNPSSSNQMFIASKRHGLCRLDLRTGEVSVLVTLPADSRPVYLSENDGILWLATSSGVVKYSVENGTCSTLKHDNADKFSLSDDYTTTAIQTSDGSLFIGTTTQGIDYHSPSQDIFKKFYKTSDGEPLDGSSICGFAQDRNGIVWVASKGNGLMTLDPGTGALARKNIKGLPETLNALCIDGDNLWIGYHKGICRLDIRTENVKSYPHFTVSDVDIDNRVLRIFKSSDGKIFLCTSVGVMAYDPAADKFRKVECLGDRAIEYMAEDGDGTIWVASYSQGVLAYDQFNDTVTGHWHGNSIPDMVSSVCLDKNGDLWAIGFNTGFYKYDRRTGQFRAYNRENIENLPTEVFFAARPDDFGNLWLSSDKGLVRYNEKNGSIKVFNKRSGLVDDFLNKSGITLSDGRLLFGSTDGFIMFNPADFQAKGGIPNVAITDFAIGDDVVVPSEDGAIRENIDVARSIELKPGENSFGFNFAAPASDVLQSDRILCKLDGYDPDWRDISSDMSVFYYNIPAGKYTFRITVVEPSGEQVSAHQDIRMEVRPPFWQSAAGLATLAGIILMITAVSIGIVLKRQEDRHRKAQEELEQQREKEMLAEKMSFFSNVIHEIKTPLTLIRTPLQNIMSGEKASDTADDLKIIRNSTDYLDKLVKELLDFVKVEQHGYVLERKNIDIVDLINYACYNFSETAKDRNIKLKFNHPQDHIVLAADEKALMKIINNLIHNAVKYAESYINISISIDGDNVSVNFRNDGPAIPAGRRKEIFKPFIQFSNERASYSQSFGIGLPLAKTLAELHGGSLTLADGSETNFILKLPVKTEENSLAVMEAPVESGQSLPMLLLVEDNPELQSYLKRKLRTDYRILAFASAENALEALKTNKVDIILTDIALQKMSGVELCRKVSSDPETSRIPIIVLSAISSEKTKIRCMEYGAALYIEKPFTLDYLTACIKSIIENKRKIKESMQDADAATESKSINLVERDADFVRKLDSEIQKHMSDPSFNVLNLEEALYMSRSSLTRKIRSLLGTSPVEYLRSRRLAAAAEMLATGKHRVSEICYAVGFRSPSYFSKCFKETYGCLPAEYASKNETDSPKNAIN